MNAPQDTFPACATNASAPEQFAIHFHMPDSEPNRILFHADDPILLAMLTGGFQVLLEESFGRAMPAGSVGVAGALVDGLLLFEAPQRTKAIDLALKFFKHHSAWMEIARYHAAELQWITVHPAPCDLPFARWLTDEQHAARASRTEPIIAQLKLLTGTATDEGDQSPTGPTAPQ